ncbi:MAG TPA: hypothetical protein VFR09_02115, partial [Alphaproteobacteria bacterium]|nr:hypothetical protein [Alphaproteobacteria bacterium]
MADDTPVPDQPAPDQPDPTVNTQPDPTQDAGAGDSGDQGQQTDQNQGQPGPAQPAGQQGGPPGLGAVAKEAVINLAGPVAPIPTAPLLYARRVVPAAIRAATPTDALLARAQRAQEALQEAETA